MERIGKTTALAIIKQVRPEVESKMIMATTMAEQQLAGILSKAEQNMNTVLGEELQRLQALRSVNPSIREEEIDHIKFRTNECAIHIQHANLQLQALRLIITT